MLIDIEANPGPPGKWPLKGEERERVDRYGLPVVG